MNFRIGSIPVRVGGSFLLTMLLLGGIGANGVAQAVIWLVVVFLSVMLHELGHAIAVGLFGLTPRIELHGMGGTTTWAQPPDHPGMRPWQVIVVSLAGPFVGFVVGFLTLLITAFSRPPDGSLLHHTVLVVIWVNIGWGVLNLLPTLPLDGGNVMATVLTVLFKGRGVRLARIVSMIVSVALAGLSAGFREPWLAFIFGLFAFRNFQAYRQFGAAQAELALYEQLSQGFGALQREDGRTAIACAEPVVQQARTPELRVEALRLLSYARVLEGHWGPLMAMLEASGRELGPGELERLENAARECGRPEEAERIRTMRQEFSPAT
jgi:Zn-dependent protease